MQQGRDRHRTSAVKRIILILVAIGSSGHAVQAQPFQYQWNIRDIVRADANIVELRTRKKLLIGKVDVGQMRILYAVKSSIEAVAEISTELIITDGKQPNAFAAKEKNGNNVIGINFAMLDVIELDVHAAAALIGHEIAHLKLRHGEQAARNKQTSSMIKIFGGVALSSLGVPASGLISDITVTAISTKYSRENETEADYLGAIWAIEARYEAEGAVRLHQEIFDRSKHRPMPFLSSHPSGPTRILKLKQLSNRLSR
jgi:predicted Zn-dependent protease